MNFGPRGFPERDRKTFRELHKIALARYCDRILDELRQGIANKTESSHDRYLKIYRIIHRRDKELGQALNDFRRSTAFQQLLLINSLGLWMLLVLLLGGDAFGDVRNRNIGRTTTQEMVSIAHL
jgi:hypothetical protein